VTIAHVKFRRQQRASKGEELVGVSLRGFIENVETDSVLGPESHLFDVRPNDYNLPACRERLSLYR